MSTKSRLQQKVDWATTNKSVLVMVPVGDLREVLAAVNASDPRGYAALSGYEVGLAHGRAEGQEAAKFLRFDDMTWPNPDGLGDVEWNLRYGHPTKSDLLVAASVIEAYKALVHLPQRTRNDRIRSIRASLTEGKDTT